MQSLSSNVSSTLGYDDPLNKQGLLYSQPQRQTTAPPSNAGQQPQQASQPGGITPQIQPPVPPQNPPQVNTGQQPPTTQPNKQPATQGTQQPNVGPTQGQDQQQGAQAQNQQFQPTQLADQLSNFLNNRFFNYQGPAGFQAPAFQPNQNPFVPQFQQNPIMGAGGQAQQFSQNWLNTPSRFDTPLVQQSVNLMNQTMDQNQAAQIQANNADAASRGLYYSSVPQGTEGDIRIRTEQGKQQFLNQLLSEQAQTVAQDRAAALQGALGYSGQQTGQDIAQFQAGLQGRGQQFGEAATGYGLGLQGQQQGFQQQQQTLQDMLGYQQQNFQNQLATANFNQSQDALQQQLLISLLGSA